MKYRVIHRTEYQYGDTADSSHNVAHLSPRSDEGQTVLSHYLSVVPQPVVLEERTDIFGNRTVYFSVERPHQEMVVTATSTVEPHRGGMPVSSGPWLDFRQQLDDVPHTERIRARSFMLDSPLIPHLQPIKEFAAPSFDRHPYLLDAARDLMTRIFKEFTYDPAFTTLTTPLLDVLQHRRGVCQDFAHLAIAALRSYGLAARYVSGYLETRPPEGQEKKIGADASHAWASVFLPGSGWLDIDPTNNQHPDNHYLVTGWGRDYADVAPLKGVIYGGGKHTLKVAVDVEPID